MRLDVRKANYERIKKICQKCLHLLIVFYKIYAFIKIRC
jgi:hypothetical protein